MHDLEVVFFQGWQIPLDRCACRRLHLIDTQTAIDLHVIERGVESLQVIAQPIGLLLEAARHLKDHVTIHEGAVEDRDTCFHLGNELAIEVDDSVGHDCWSR